MWKRSQRTGSDQNKGVEDCGTGKWIKDIITVIEAGEKQKAEESRMKIVWVWGQMPLAFKRSCETNWRNVT